MFIEHAQASLPAFGNVAVSSTGVSSGSSRTIVLPSSMVSTHAFAQVLSVTRLNTSVTGLPAGTLTLSGSKPSSVTLIATREAAGSAVGAAGAGADGLAVGAVAVAGGRFLASVLLRGRRDGPG